jgi:serine/threonine-protein kinase
VGELQRPEVDDPTTPLAAPVVAERSLGGTLVTAVTTPSEAMRNDGVERFKRLGFPAIVVMLGGMLAVVPLMPGDVTARRLFAGGLAIYLAGALWFRWIVRDPARFTEGNLLVLGLTGAAAAASGVYYWGVFSPAPIVIATGVYLASLDGGVRQTTIVYAACAGPQLVLSGAIIGGAIADPGLIRADDATTFTQIATQIVIQGAFLIAFVGGRIARRVTFDSVVLLDRAAREAAKREALIDEIRQDLRRAVGVGGPGRFTDQVFGSYRLGLLIGRGGVGEVYEARHIATGAPAAIKLLQLAHLADDRYHERFAREAQAAAALASPHVVALLDFHAEPGKLPYLAMERLDGSELAALLQQRRTLPVADVVELVAQIAAGLECARVAGIVHRDLKPHNVFLTSDDVWKILDFGVSKLADHGGTLTQGAVIGTPSYMAPEQARGQDVDHRADVYALGAIAYRALVGRAPFGSGELAEVVHRVVSTMPPRPNLTPRALDAVLAVALCKDPARRFSTALELAGALRAAADDRLDPAIVRRADDVLAGLPWS